MNALIPIIQREGKAAVSARDLYRFLELDPANYARWTKSNIVENEFALEGDDWALLRTNEEYSGRGQLAQDYALTLPFAKKLAMMSKSARAEQVRDYFIECERRALRTPTVVPDLSDPLIMANMLQDATARFIEAETARREAVQQLAVQAPAVAFARKVEFSPVDVSVGTFAKMIDWGPNKLHEELRRRGFMFHRDGRPVPKQKYVAQGLFLVREVPVKDRVYPVATITGKGQLWLARELGVGVQPVLELARGELEPAGAANPQQQKTG